MGWISGPGSWEKPAGRDTSRAWMPSSSGVTVRPVAGHARRRRRKDAGEVVGASGWRAVSHGFRVCICVCVYASARIRARGPLG